MGLFGKKKETHMFHIMIDGKGFYVEPDLYDAINELRDKYREAIHDKGYAEKELEAIKPIFEEGKLKPAVTRNCGVCRFVVRSVFSQDIIGCRKDAVCEDFCKQEE